MPKQNAISALFSPNRPRKIMLLDDDPDVCEVLSMILEWKKFQVTVVHRGVEGVQAVMDSDFDAILCDMMMPAMPGDMFYLAVQKLKPHLCRRFIFITAHQGDAKLETFLQMAARHVLYKPLATDELLERIEQVMAITRAMDEDLADTLELEMARQNAARKLEIELANRKKHLAGQRKKAALDFNADSCWLG